VRKHQLPLHDECTDEEQGEAEHVSVKAENEGIRLLLGCKLLHYDWIQAKPHLETKLVENNGSPGDSAVI